MQPHQKKILLVDDDPDILEIVSFILRDEGYEVAELNNGTEVVPTVLNIHPDLVLLDVMLGDMDGRDICKQLKSEDQTSAIPVIMVSATHGWRSITEKNCQADGFIEKPFDIVYFLDHIKRYAA